MILCILDLATLFTSARRRGAIQHASDFAAPIVRAFGYFGGRGAERVRSAYQAAPFESTTGSFGTILTHCFGRSIEPESMLRNREFADSWTGLQHWFGRPLSKSTVFGR